MKFPAANKEMLPDSSVGVGYIGHQAVGQVACITDETQPLVTSVCETASKSLFCTPNLVPGSEYVS